MTTGGHRSSPCIARASVSSNRAGRRTSSPSPLRQGRRRRCRSSRCARRRRDRPSGSWPASTARSRPGPNAVAAAIDDIALLGEHRAVVLLPLLNPHGYARNWRYLNVAVYSESVDGHSVGDSSHVLPSAEDLRSRARARPFEPGGGRDHRLDPAAAGGLSGCRQHRPARGQPDRRGLRLFAGHCRRGGRARDGSGRGAARERRADPDGGRPASTSRSPAASSAP